jgi:ribose-phosphate pyrophosphokinase
MIPSGQDYFLVADQNGAAWDFATNIYNYIRKRENRSFADLRATYLEGVCGELGDAGERSLVERMVDQSRRQFGSNVNLIPLEVKNHRDGEHVPHVTKNIRGGHCYIIHDGNLNPDRWLVQALTSIDAVKDAEKRTLVTPYTKFMRQDRRDRARTSVTTRVLADCLDATGNKVLTVDVHNKATEALYRQSTFDALHSFPTVTEYLAREHPEMMGNLVVVSPDVGGGERAEKYGNWLGTEEVVVGVKTRSAPGQIKELRFPTNVDFTGKYVLIVDDILDSGGTMGKAASVAKGLGARKVYGYCTHGLFTEGYEEVLTPFDRMFISNTIHQPYMNGMELPGIAQDKLTIIPFDDLFGEAIYRIHNKMSISDLFRKKKPA